HWRGAFMNVSGFQSVRVNGLPGFILQFSDGPAIMAIEPDDEGRIAAIYAVRNPEKLTHIG
ncbi:MAG TPA: RNA polymerase sigma factor SigJ, partial [Caulobacteraceae bacterium]|nr:RNA polymerase sigma factor SigJ [Caulobacteraceae bacterium]